MNRLNKIRLSSDKTNLLINNMKNEVDNVTVALRKYFIQQLSEENRLLRLEIEKTKQKLCELESKRGVKQISVPRKGANKTDELNKIEEKVEQNAKESSTKEITKNGEKKIKKGETNEKKTKVGTEKKSNPKNDKENTELPIDVGRLDLRVGLIKEINNHPDADSLYVSKIDCGDPEPRTVISGLVKFIDKEILRGSLVVVLCNLKPVKMRGILSEAMVLCASTPEKIEVLRPPKDSLPGDVVVCDEYIRQPDQQLNPKKKVFETCAPDLKTDSNLIACYKNTPLKVLDKGFLTAQTLSNVNIK